MLVKAPKKSKDSSDSAYKESKQRLIEESKEEFYEDDECIGECPCIDTWGDEACAYCCKYCCFLG